MERAAGWLSLAVCAAIVGCGGTPPGMDPPRLECDGIETCGQCNSNPGCGWCDGKCVEAPDGDVRKAPTYCQDYYYQLDTCPVLPEPTGYSGDRPLPPTTAEEDEGTSPYEGDDSLGDEAYEELRRGLKWAFRGANAGLPDEVVDGVLQVMDQKHNSQLSRIKDIVSEALPVAELGRDEKRYYTVTPTHSRVGMAEPQEQFEQPVPMARYRLPDTGEEDIETALGKAWAGDRKFNNLADFVNRTRDSIGYAAARVDVIAGIRWIGRFAPVTLYLAYKNERDPLPSFYVMAAGVATGQSRTAYLSKTMDPKRVQVQAQGMYEPTAFSNNAHWYNATLTMKGDDPESIVITSSRSKSGKDAYIEITMEYEAHGKRAPANIIGYEYLLQSAARLAAIAEGICMETSFGRWQPILSAIGRKELGWENMPNTKRCSRGSKKSEDSSEDSSGDADEEPKTQ